MLPDSLDCPFLFAPSVFSNVYLHKDISFGFLINLDEDFNRRSITFLIIFHYDGYG